MDDNRTSEGKGERQNQDEPSADQPAPSPAHEERAATNESRRDRYREVKRRLKKARKYLPVIGRVAEILFLLATVVVMYLQFREMLISNKTTRRSIAHADRTNKKTIKEMKESNRTTRQALELSERPWIGLSEIEATLSAGRVDVAGIFTNVGTAPALKAKLCGHIIAFPQPTEPPDTLDPYWMCGAEFKNRESGEFIIPGAKQRMSGDMRSSWDESDFQSFKEGTLGVYYFGWALYLDPLGNEHEMSFCVRLRPDNRTITCKKGNDST